MKIKSMLIAVITIISIISNGLNAQNNSDNTLSKTDLKDKKVLIAYYSKTNNTKQIAENIQSYAGGDIFRIETQKSYPSEYQPATEVAKKEKEENVRPALKAKVKDISQYDVIFIGFPIWWSDTPMAIASFLESYDLSGKTIVPFCSHGGGGVGEAFNRVKKLTPNSINLDGLVIQGKGSKNNIEDWLGKLQLLK